MGAMTQLPSHLAVIMLVVGVVLLAGGASWLVDGASRLAARLGIAPLVVGLVVVGFGTSTPELSVSVIAALRGSGGLSLGNAVGSNIMNLLLVLGVAAVIVPVQVAGSRRVVARDLVLGVIPAVMLMAIAWNGRLGRSGALALVTFFGLALGVWLHSARGRRTEPREVPGSIVRDLAFTVAGIATLVVGAELLVHGGVGLARAMGVSEAVIGLTLVAFGTSLPELAASVAAVVKGQAELSVGNILGSNVFNLGLIVGTAFAIRPGGVPIFVVRQDVPVLLLATAVTGALILRRGRLGRGEALMMLGLFVAYLGFVVARGGG